MTPEQFFTVGQLATATGQNYSYIKSRLKYWTDWEYLKRKIGTTSGGQPCWTYALAKKGFNYIYARIPSETREKYLAELKAYQVRGEI